MPSPAKVTLGCPTRKVRSTSVYEVQISVSLNDGNKCKMVLGSAESEYNVHLVCTSSCRGILSRSSLIISYP